MVLIVDDDTAIAETLGLVLNNIRISYDIATCVQSAKAKLEAEIDRISVVLVDFVLADGDGSEIVAECRRKRPDLPIVLMSAMAPTKLECIAQELRVDEYLAKPFSIERLEEIIRDCQKKSVNILTAG